MCLEDIINRLDTAGGVNEYLSRRWSKLTRPNSSTTNTTAASAGWGIRCLSGTSWDEKRVGLMFFLGGTSGKASGYPGAFDPEVHLSPTLSVMGGPPIVALPI